MAIFFVTPISDAAALKRAIKEKIGDEVYFLPGHSGAAFVAFNGTTKDLSDALGITSNDEVRVSTGVVLPVSNYYGRGPTDMWEWLKVRMERA